MTRETVPVELAFIFVILGLCCRLQLSGGHFESSSRDDRARQAHRLGVCTENLIRVDEVRESLRLTR